MLPLLLCLLTPLPPEARPLPVAPPPRRLYQWVNRDSGECGWYARKVWVDGHLWDSRHSGDIEDDDTQPGDGPGSP